LLLILLWQPAIMVAELRPQQNIIAVLVDDSRSMAIADTGAGSTLSPPEIEPAGTGRWLDAQSP
jgi:hypothetical protein